MNVKSYEESDFFGEPFFFSSQISPNGTKAIFSCINYNTKGKTSVFEYNFYSKEYKLLVEYDQIAEIKVNWIGNDTIYYYSGEVIYIKAINFSQKFVFSYKIESCWQDDKGIWVLSKNILYFSNLRDFIFKVIHDKVTSVSFYKNRFVWIENNLFLRFSNSDLIFEINEFIKEKNIEIAISPDSNFIFFSSISPTNESTVRLVKIFRLHLKTELLEIFFENEINVLLRSINFKWTPISNEEILMLCELKGEEISKMRLVKKGIHIPFPVKIDASDFNWNSNLEQVYLSGISIKNHYPERYGYIFSLSESKFNIVDRIYNSHSNFSWSDDCAYAYIFKDNNGNYFYLHSDSGSHKISNGRCHNRVVYKEKEYFVLKKIYKKGNSCIVYIPGLHRHYTFGIKDLFFQYALEQLQNFFLSQKYIVIGLNGPGSTGYGSLFRREIKTLQKAVYPMINGFLINQPLEGKKVFITGSIGTLSLLKGLSLNDENLYIILISPVFELPPHLSEFCNIIPEKNYLEFISSLKLSDSIKVLTFNGVFDELSDLIQVSHFHSTLNGSVNKMVTIPNEGHVFKSYRTWFNVSQTINKFIS